MRGSLSSRRGGCRATICLALLTASVLAGCGSDGKPSASAGSTAPPSSAAPTTLPSQGAPAPPAVTPRPSDSRPTPTPTSQLPVSRSQLLSDPLTTDGLGPLAVGMTSAEVTRVLGRTVTPQYLDDGQECGTAVPYGDSAHPVVDLMFTHDRLVVVSTYAGSLRTPSGFGIGTAESAVRSRFGSALRVEPHEYVPGGHYLSFTATSDSSRRLVFETDGSEVTAMHGGKSPYVNYVEGCA